MLDTVSTMWFNLIMEQRKTLENRLPADTPGSRNLTESDNRYQPRITTGNPEPYNRPAQYRITVL